MHEFCLENYDHQKPFSELSEGVVEDGGIEVDGTVLEEVVHGTVLDEIGGGAGEDLAIGGDEPQFVGEHQRLGNVMTGEQDGRAAVVGKGLQQAHRLNAAGDVKEGCRLIKDDDGRLLSQCTGNHRLLPLAITQ